MIDKTFSQRSVKSFDSFLEKKKSFVGFLQSVHLIPDTPVNYLPVFFFQTCYSLPICSTKLLSAQRADLPRWGDYVSKKTLVLLHICTCGEAVRS